MHEYDRHVFFVGNTHMNAVTSCENDLQIIIYFFLEYHLNFFWSSKACVIKVGSLFYFIKYLFSVVLFLSSLACAQRLLLI